MAGLKQHTRSGLFGQVVTSAGKTQIVVLNSVMGPHTPPNFSESNPRAKIALKQSKTPEMLATFPYIQWCKKIALLNNRKRLTTVQ